MGKHWIRLTDHDYQPGAWLNMAAVAAVRPTEKGGLRIEMIGEQEQDPANHPVVYHKADVEAILAYLNEGTFSGSSAAEQKRVHVGAY